jgi:hypothetical protein
VLQRTRAHERRLASPDRDQQQLGSLHCRLARRFREEGVLTDQQRHPPEIRLKHRHRLAGRDAAGCFVQRHLHLAVLAGDGPVAIDEHGGVVETGTVALEHPECDVDAVAARHARHHVRAGSGNRLCFGVVRSRRADHVQQLAQNHDVRPVRRGNLFGETGRSLDRVEAARRAGRPIIDGRDANRPRRRRRRWGEAQGIERHVPGGRPLQHQLHVHGARAARRAEDAIEEHAPVGLGLVLPHVIRAHFIAECTAPAQHDRHRFAYGRDVGRECACAEAIMVPAVQSLYAGPPSAVDALHVVAGDVERVAGSTRRCVHGGGRFGAWRERRPPGRARRDQFLRRHEPLRHQRHARSEQESPNLFPAGIHDCLMKSRSTSIRAAALCKIRTPAGGCRSAAPRSYRW